MIGSLPILDAFNFKSRVERDVSNDNKPTALAGPSPSVGGIVAPNKPNDGSNQTQSITLENGNKPLLGVNGTGQRLNVTAPATIPKPAIVSEPLHPDADATQPAKGLTTSASSNATATSTTPAPDIDDGIIDSVDTPKENINKTIRDNLNVTYKDDYYQYYNSTTLVDKAKSDKYWSDLTNFTHNSLLSKSHRRAIVCICALNSAFIVSMHSYFI